MIHLTCTQIREVEHAAVNTGMGYLRLMENAGSAAARLIRSQYDIKEKSVVILCGKGNNGGDGFVIARKLYEEGANVTVVLACGEPASENAVEMLSRIQQSDITIISLKTEPYLASSSIQSASILVDSVYGIGFHDTLPDYLRSLFRLVLTHSVPLIAIDIPSGVNADTGEADVDALKADTTITFIAMKAGMATPTGQSICGKIQVACIGIDEELLQPYTQNQSEINMDMVRKCFTSRPQDSNKGDYGRLLTLCGSHGMMGAAIMAVKAALRCGTGLVVSALPRSLYPVAAVSLCEPIFCMLDETTDGDFALPSRTLLREQQKRCTAMLIGCGLGTSNGAQALVLDCLTQSNQPIVLDADGINIIAKHINILKAVRVPLILTPHPGEMARLTGMSISDIQNNRMQVACNFADKFGVTLVLKGHNTVIASPGYTPLINTTGNPGMSTGGSGDVLAGMIAAFLAQGMPPQQAALCGVHLHGLAGDHASARLSQHAMLPTDMIDELSKLFLNLENRS